MMRMISMATMMMSILVAINVANAPIVVMMMVQK
jgi:hypothetical protein